METQEILTLKELSITSNPLKLNYENNSFDLVQSDISENSIILKFDENDLEIFRNEFVIYKKDGFKKDLGIKINGFKRIVTDVIFEEGIIKMILG